MTPLLTIGIPTYNRSPRLQRTLDIVVGQISRDRDLADQVELVISDNASTDDTPVLVAGYLEKNSFIRYFRNSENLGFDRNVDAVMNRAAGVFCWLLSDDDYLEHDAIRFVCERLRRLSAAVSVVIIDIAGILSEGLEEKTFDSGSLFLDRYALNGTGGLLSQCIFRRERLPLDRSRYIGSHWFHYALALEAYVHTPVVLLKNIFLPQQNAVCAWAKNGFSLITYSALRTVIIRLSRCGYDQKLVRKLDRIIIRTYPSVIASAKLYGLRITRANTRLIVDNLIGHPLQLLLSLVLYLCPPLLLRVIRKTRKLFSVQEAV